MVAVLQLLQHRLVVFLQCHFADGHKIVPCGTHLSIAFDLVLKLACLLHDLLRKLLIVPEAVRFDLRMEPVKILLRTLDIQGKRQIVQLRPDGIELHLILVKFNHTHNQNHTSTLIAPIIPEKSNSVKRKWKEHGDAPQRLPNGCVNTLPHTGNDIFRHLH